MPTPSPPAPAQLVLTIMPDGSMLVSLRYADGTQAPARTIAVDLDWRLAAFVASAQAFARQHLAAVKSPSVRPTARPDGDPTIADAADGEQIGQRA
jgi:hypothetical protein